MPDGSLGLIDYGQTKTLSAEQRLRVARVVLALGRKSGHDEIAKEMRALGFKTKLNNEKTLAKYAALFFDSDMAAKDEGCSTPQLYFAKLTTEDPLVHVPDVASKSFMKSVYFLLVFYSKSESCSDSSIVAAICTLESFCSEGKLHPQRYGDNS